MSELLLLAGKDPLVELGGHSTYVRAHARAAAMAGYRPHLFAVAPRDEVLETDFGTLHRVHSPFRPFRQVMVPGHLPLLARAVGDFVAGTGGDCLVHAFGIWGSVIDAVRARHASEGRLVPIASAYTTYFHESAAKLRGTRSCHGALAMLARRVEHAWVSSVVHRYERRSYSSARLVLVNYESVRSLLVAAHPDLPEVRTLPYSTEASLVRAAAGIADRRAATSGSSAGAEPMIVCLSRHDARKGIDVLLRALGRMARRGVGFRARLIGPGALMERHRALARELGLEERVAIPGRVEDAEAELRRADVFVLPSLQEGSGSLSLLEALEVGVAAVASACDGIPEDLRDGVDGLLVPPGDVEALSRALAALVADAQLRERLARAGAASFRERFAPDRFVARLSGLYRELGFAPNGGAGSPAAHAGAGLLDGPAVRRAAIAGSPSARARLSWSGP